MRTSQTQVRLGTDIQPEPNCYIYNLSGLPTRTEDNEEPRAIRLERKLQLERAILPLAYVLR